MTMLDRMRRHKAWLKWSLGIVVLTFVLLYVPQFLGGTTVTSTGAFATVDGREVPVALYQQAYSQQINQIRQSYGDIPEASLRQLGIGRRLMDQLVNDEAIIVEAERRGFSVSDGELRARLMQSPMFQEDGAFIGEERYRQILAGARPPMRPADYEGQLRKALLAEKLQEAVSGWIRVTDAEVDQEFRRRNEKVKLDIAVFTADKFKGSAQPTDAEIDAQYSAHRDDYRVPEKRRVRYLAVDAESLRSKMAATPQEVEARYNDSIASYSVPEQVRASHILLKTEGKDEAAVRKVAESVLAKVKAGGDFAALAEQFSEDDGSKVNGGDLDYFGKGAMVKEFEDAAWAMSPGQVSDLVKSQFGFHIIKVVDHRQAVTKSLNDVRAQLEDSIRLEKARAEATRLAAELAGQIKTPADLDRVAKERGMPVKDSGLFSREEPLSGLGFAPAVATEAFTLDMNKVSGQLSTDQGYAFITLAEVKPPYVPTLADVREKVKDDASRLKAIALAKTKAAAMAASATSNFGAAAKSAGVEVKSTDFITRGSALPEVGTSDAVDLAAFALKAGETSAPVTLDNAVVVVRVKERQDVAPEILNAQRESLRTEIRQQKSGEFFSAYMLKARQTMTIKYNETVVSTLIGG